LLFVVVASCERVEQREAHRRVAQREPAETPPQAKKPPAPSDCDPEWSDIVDDTCPTLAAEPPDRYRGLSADDVGQRQAAALAVLLERDGQARAVTRRALAVAAAHPACALLRPVTETLRDCDTDVYTRAAAALALGAVARRRPCLFPGGTCRSPHDPLPQWSQQTLRKCSKSYPLYVARACVEALGFMTTAEVDGLRQLRDDPNGDALIRVFAGRAMTRLTETSQVTSASLEELVGTASTLVEAP